MYSFMNVQQNPFLFREKDKGLDIQEEVLLNITSTAERVWKDEVLKTWKFIKILCKGNLVHFCCTKSLRSFRF